MSKGWPAWLDEATQAAVEDRTCPDCFWVDPATDNVVYAKFQGQGCRHAPEDAK